MSQLKTFQVLPKQVLKLRAGFGATSAGKGGFFQGFSRVFQGGGCPEQAGMCWGSSPAVTQGRHMKGRGQLSPGDAPALHGALAATAVPQVQLQP